MKKIVKALSRVFEALGFIIVIGSFHLIPIRWSSRCGAFLAGTLGPFVSVSKQAKERLRRAIPGLSDIEYNQIIKNMWRNIGSTFAEYPRLKKVPLFIKESPVEVVGLEHVDRAIAENKPIIFVLGHLANWELATRVLRARGLPIAQVYRRVNNPLIARLVRHIHGSMVSELVEKGAGGARQLIDVMKRREALSVLIDQKMNEGIAVPFFGRDAMTAPGIAKLSLKFDAPIIPVRVERLAHFRFRVTYYPPLKAINGSQDDAVYDLLLQINQHLESWIKERPEQWFWIHNRWPKEKGKGDI